MTKGFPSRKSPTGLSNSTAKIERKITPHWVGHIVRRKLGLKTGKHHGSYVIASSEGPKLIGLFEKYGVSTTPGGLGGLWGLCGGHADATSFERRAYYLACGRKSIKVSAPPE
jgi:hypothetical protein